MRWSEALLETRRTAPADVDTISAALVHRAGLAVRLASGIYGLSPVAVRVQRRIEAVVREEMDAVGGQEVLLPVVNPAELWQRSGRDDSAGHALAHFADRTGHPMVLALSHEEAATSLVREMAHSYRQLPRLVYQIQTKFRDEARPRAGLIRLREFVMKDAYSFHLDTEDLDRTYDRIAQAYRRIFERLDLSVVVVQSDSGLMGGKVAHEFMLPAESGEDRLILCGCGYAANQDVARRAPPADGTGIAAEWYRESGPNGRLVLAIVPAGRTVASAKLAAVVGGDVTPAGTPEGIQWTPAGTGSPVAPDVVVVTDPTVESRHVGTAQVRERRVADITAVAAADPCPQCGRPLREERGIEVGNIFKLGTRYSEALGLAVTDAGGCAVVPPMGCYGIGITRLLAAVVEAHHDDRGIVWPRTVAPWAVELVTTRPDGAVRAAADRLYEDLGPDRCLYDDRRESPGVKFHDADLLGMPTRITVSPQSLARGGVELSDRATGHARVVPAEEVARALTTAP